jgi:hypothetical protein
MSILYKLSVGFISCVSLLMGTLEANSRTNNPLPKESSAFQCLLNIPMGISPGELNEYLAKCPNLKMYDYVDNTIITQLYISSYNNQTLFNTTCALLKDGKDSLSEVYFYFYKGKLYEVSGVKQFDNNRSSFIASQISNLYGKPTKKKNLRNFMGNEFYLYSQYWRYGNSSITLDDDREVSHMLIIQNDSISKIVNDIYASYVDVEVFTYYGYDTKEKQSISPWERINNDPNDIPSIRTYCEGIGKINLKGKAKGLTFTLACEDGTIVFEKTGVTVKGKTTILSKNEFPENCESKDYSNDQDNPAYSTHYTLTVSKLGHQLFVGKFFRDDCMD